MSSTVQCELKKFETSLGVLEKRVSDLEKNAVGEISRGDIEDLHRSNRLMMDKIDDLENRHGRGNLVFVGVPEESNETAQSLETKIKKKLPRNFGC